MQSPIKTWIIAASGEPRKTPAHCIDRKSNNYLDDSRPQRTFAGRTLTPTNSFQAVSRLTTRQCVVGLGALASARIEDHARLTLAGGVKPASVRPAALGPCQGREGEGAPARSSAARFHSGICALAITLSLIPRMMMYGLRIGFEIR
jgi:hypothetical protein